MGLEAPGHASDELAKSPRSIPWNGGLSGFPSVAIFGTSVRALACSALRAGLSVKAFDRFGDHDLQAIAPWRELPARPDDDQLAALLHSTAADAWMYAGAWENYPDRVELLASVRPLWGISPESLREVRDPFRLHQFLEREGAPSPEVQGQSISLPRDGSWLVKPLRSGGGRAISSWELQTKPLPEPAYYQRRVEGIPLGAIFAGQQAASAEFLGASLQLTGRPGHPFGYVGSIGPWPLTPAQEEEIVRIGRLIASKFRLLGLFGVDLILDDDRPWVIEVNPRYTASVEILELATGRALLRDHLRSFNVTLTDALFQSQIDRPDVVGKTVLFAERKVSLDSSLLQSMRLEDDHWQVPMQADLPAQAGPFQRRRAPVHCVRDRAERNGMSRGSSSDD